MVEEIEAFSSIAKGTSREEIMIITYKRTSRVFLQGPKRREKRMKPV